MSAGACPCGASAGYAACCGRWHTGAAAPSAEALMRSRYCAFVRGNEAYLLATWHAGTRPASVAFDAATKWLGLKVVSSRETGADAAEVQFIARYRVGGAPAVRLQELSRFVREQGRWYYVDGDIR